MSDTLDRDTRKLIDSALFRAVRADGPVKLYHGKDDRDGLFSNRTRRGREAAKFGSETHPELWVEEPRKYGNAPIYVRLRPAGLERLIEQTPAGEREDLIRSASGLYQRNLLEHWADLAAARKWKDDFPMIANCCSELIHQLHRLIPDGSDVSLPSSNGSGTGDRNLSADEADFKRRMAHELVVAWKYAPTPEAKQGIANALKNSGVKQIGEPSQRLKLDGGLHRCEEPAFPGDEVEVVESGWLVHDGVGEYLLEKAIVKLI